MGLNSKMSRQAPHFPLLRLSPDDFFDISALLENTAIFGQPGSGKTSAGGAHIAKAALRAGCGILVLCAKPDERALWERYCAETGRTGSIIIFDGRQHRYNFIAAEIDRLGIGAINGVIDLILSVMESARSLSPNSRQGSDIFWEDIIRLILRHLLIVLFIATGTITIADIVAFVQSAPRSQEELNDTAWRERSFFAQCFEKALPKMDAARGEQMAAFWRDSWIGLDPKTRTNAAISLVTTLDRFNHGWLRDAFCTDTTMAPELLAHGAVIILDMPALTHMDDGILGQRLLKFITQRVLLARQSYGPSHAERIVVIWMDEAPVFVDSHDAKFLALCRSTRSCMVLMAQSLPSYYAVMSGENARDRVDQLLSNCATKIWFCNSCPVTNKFAAETIGKALQQRGNFSESEGQNLSHGVNLGDGTNWGTNSGSGHSVSFHSEQRGINVGFSSNSGRSSGGNESRGRNRSEGTNRGVSQGFSEVMDYILEPGAFARMLKTGGAANGNRVSGIWFRSGHIFQASGGNALLLEFVQ